MTNIDFLFSDYAVVVTPAGGATGSSYDSVGGNLLVKFEGGAQNFFAFTVYALP